MDREVGRRLRTTVSGHDDAGRIQVAKLYRTKTSTPETLLSKVDYDLTGRQLLATWGGVGYRHACGCLAVAGFVGHRVARGGFDAWLGFDLAP